LLININAPIIESNDNSTTKPSVQYHYITIGYTVHKNATLMLNWTPDLSRRSETAACI